MKMTDDDKMTDARLDALFEEARANPPEVPEALMARVVADAAREQPQRSDWRAWLAGLGGLPGLGGLITASCVGFWLGVAPPEGLPDLAGSFLGAQFGLQDDLSGGTLGAFGWDIEEG